MSNCNHNREAGKGEPKGSKSFQAKVLEELEKEVTVNKNGEALKMTKFDVGVMQLVDRFMAGDPKATKIIFLCKVQAEKERASEEIDQFSWTEAQEKLYKEIEQAVADINASGAAQ
jgi:hypothetical protein